MTDHQRSFDRPMPINSALGPPAHASPYTSAERPIQSIKSTAVTNFGLIDTSHDDCISMNNPLDHSGKIPRKNKFGRGVAQTLSVLSKKQEVSNRTTQRKTQQNSMIPHIIASPGRARANRTSNLSRDEEDTMFAKKARGGHMPGAFVYNPALTGAGRHSVGPKHGSIKNKLSGNSNIQYQHKTAKAIRHNRGSINAAHTTHSTGKQQNSLYTPLLFDDWVTSSQEGKPYPSSNHTSKPTICQKQMIDAVLKKRSSNRFKEDVTMYKNYKTGVNKNSTLQNSVTIQGEETDNSQINSQYMGDSMMFRSGPSPKRVKTSDPLSSDQKQITSHKKQNRKQPFILANEINPKKQACSIVPTTSLSCNKKAKSDVKGKKLKSNWMSNMYRRNQLLKNGIDLQPIRKYQLKQKDTLVKDQNSQSGWSLPKIAANQDINTPTRSNLGKASPTAYTIANTNMTNSQIATKLEIFREDSDSASQVYSVANPKVQSSHQKERTFKRRIASVSGAAGMRSNVKPATAALISRPNINSITQSVLAKNKNRFGGGATDKEDASKASFVVTTDDAMTPKRVNQSGYTENVQAFGDTNSFEIRTSIGMLSRPDHDEVRQMENIENMPEGAIFAMNQTPAPIITPNSQSHFSHVNKNTIPSSRSKDVKLDMNAYYESVNISTAKQDSLTPIKNYTRAATVNANDGYISPTQYNQTERENKVVGSPITENINITVNNHSGFLPKQKLKKTKKTPKSKRNGAKIISTTSPDILSSEAASKTTTPKILRTQVTKTSKPTVSSFRSNSKSPKKSPIKRLKKSASKSKQSSEALFKTIPQNAETVIEKSKNEFLNPKLYSMGDDPAFFNLFIEKRHAEHLAKKDLDEESRLEVIYRVLKDQLRKAKKGLLVLKKEKDNDRRRALELKRRIQLANSKPDKNSIAKNVVGERNADGEMVMKYVSQNDNISPELRVIIDRLLHSDTRKHYKYCPCCKNYDDGHDPTPEQMGEFIEFIRQQHYKIFGMPTNMRKIRPRDQKLEYDSVSEITDLSDEGILTQSFHLLSQPEQKRLKRYMSQLRTMQGYTVPKHDCFGKKPKGNRINNSRFVVEMQLRAKSEPKEFDNKSISAHQFSYRDISIQADSEERFEIAMQTSLIDLKSNYQQVDVYDLDNKRDVGMQKGNPQVGIKEMKDKAVGTDLCRRMLSSHDWYYSSLYRHLLKQYFKKNRMKVTEKMEQDWQEHDIHGHYRDINEPAPRQSMQQQTLIGHVNKDSTTQDGFTNTENFNPQDDADKRFPFELKVLSEPEITYLLNIYKGRVEKWSEPEVLQEIHQNTCFTAKTLTKEMIEGQQPMCFIIDKYTTVNVNSVKTLLYRCSKLYQTRQDVKKIILLLIKLEHHAKEMTKPQELQLWIRLSSLLGQFQTENRSYHGEFIYKGKNLLQEIDEKLKFLKVAAARMANKSVEEQKGNNAFHSKDIKEILREEAKAEKQIGQGVNSTDYISKLIERQAEYAKRGKNERHKMVDESSRASSKILTVHDSKTSENKLNHNIQQSHHSLDHQRHIKLIREELMIEEGGWQRLQQLERAKQSDGDLLNMESQQKLVGDVSFQNRATPDLVNHRSNRNLHNTSTGSSRSKTSRTKDIAAAQAFKLETRTSQTNVLGQTKSRVRASLVNKEQHRSRHSLNPSVENSSREELNTVKFANLKQ